MVTVEPGGQVEISTPPRPSVAALIRGHRGRHRPASPTCWPPPGWSSAAAASTRTDGPARWCDTPRYRAMRGAFDRRGPAGRTMMYSTAGLQVCLDAGEPDQVADRWAAVHAVGPPLLAAFATADRHAGRRTGWASARMAAWLAIDPARTRPVWSPGEPTTTRPPPGSAYVLAAPLLCLRRRRPGLDARRRGSPSPTGSTARCRDPPTTDDLDYHVSTLFPPVRPRGYLEVRYLDAQPGRRLAGSRWRC